MVDWGMIGNVEDARRVAGGDDCALGKARFVLPPLTERLKTLLLTQPLNPLVRPVVKVWTTAVRASG